MDCTEDVLRNMQIARVFKPSTQTDKQVGGLPTARQAVPSRLWPPSGLLDWDGFCSCAVVLTGMCVLSRFSCGDLNWGGGGVNRAPKNGGLGKGLNWKDH